VQSTNLCNVWRYKLIDYSAHITRRHNQYILPVDVYLTGLYRLEHHKEIRRDIASHELRMLSSKQESSTLTLLHFLSIILQPSQHDYDHLDDQSTPMNGPRFTALGSWSVRQCGTLEFLHKTRTTITFVLLKQSIGKLHEHNYNTDVA